MGYEVTFFPVGDGERSGDAIAIRFGNLFGSRTEQTVVIVDGGYAATGDEIVRHVTGNFKTSDVDLVISTHPDSDHAGGLPVVVEKPARSGCTSPGTTATTSPGCLRTAGSPTPASRRLYASRLTRLAS